MRIDTDMSNNMTEFTRRRLMFAQTQGVSVESRDYVHVVVCVLLGLWMLHLCNNPSLCMFKFMFFSHIEVLTSDCALVHRISHDISLSCVRSNKMHALCKAALLVMCAAGDELKHGRCSHQVCCCSKKKKKYPVCNVKKSS